ncbi:hypothetical protein H1R20_g3056, partial [Candolleomyces eurysporus]
MFIILRAIFTVTLLPFLFARRVLAFVAASLRNFSRLETNSDDFGLAIFTACHRSSLLPTPQWRIYTSRITQASEDDDAETSIQTVPDRTARGVITDFAVLMPILATRDPGFQSISALVELIENELRSSTPGDGFASNIRAARIVSLFAPILAKLKRPVTRHPPDILHHSQELRERLAEAQAQVLNQCHCLFSSAKYAGQRYVALIAAVGEWWTFSVRERASFSEAFEFDVYVSVREAEQQQLEDQYADAEEEPLYSPPTILTHVGDFNSLVSQREQDMTKKQNEDRELRARRRERERQNAATHAAEIADLQAFVEECGAKRFYSDYELSRLYALREAVPETAFNQSSNSFPKVPNFGFALPTNLTLEDHIDAWTGPMRLGSTQSDAYVQFIKGTLDVMVESNEA